MQNQGLDTNPDPSQKKQDPDTTNLDLQILLLSIN
jgi:hypothetical protein